jgi:hypothetical protein
MAENFDQNADTDDGSCIIAGCTDHLIQMLRRKTGLANI